MNYSTGSETPAAALRRVERANGGGNFRFKVVYAKRFTDNILSVHPAAISRRKRPWRKARRRMARNSRKLNR